MRAKFIAAAMMLVSLWGVGAPLALSASTQIASQPAGLKTHSCCPRVHLAIALPIILSRAPATMPCGGQSPCCAKQAPAKPALLALNQNQRPAVKSATLWTNDEASDARTGSVLPPAGLAPSLFLHSTVLRI